MEQVSLFDCRYGPLNFPFSGNDVKVNKQTKQQNKTNGSYTKACYNKSFTTVNVSRVNTALEERELWIIEVFETGIITEG